MAVAKPTGEQVLAGTLFLVGLGFTIYLGVLSGSQTQPSRVTSALLVLLSFIFQALSAAVFNKSGRADPSLARAAVRRLLSMGYRVKRVREISEDVFDNGKATELRKAMGIISADLSWIEDGLIDAVADWSEFHGSALEELTKKQGQQHGKD